MAAVVEHIESSGESFAAPSQRARTGFDTAITGDVEDDDEEGRSLPERIGGCRIDAHLGTGGMAEVFRGWRRGEDGQERAVVVKRMLPHLSRDPKFVEMFLREAEVATGLHHPNVVGVHGVGKEQGAHFLILEYVDGLTLHRLARRAWRARVPVPLELVAQAIADAALGLAHAHEAKGARGEDRGLVHRDVSPDNIIVDRSGVTKVLDFGIAKGAHTANITQTGEVKGKIPYMSPEQMQGGVVDHRADLYSLGVTLYWLLTGTRPFRGDSDLRLMQAILMEHPARPSALNAAVPSDIDELVLALLEKDPSKRPSSGREVAARLTPFFTASRKELALFVAGMLDAPPPPSAGGETTAPFRATSPTTDKNLGTFSARVAEIARDAAPSHAFLLVARSAKEELEDEALRQQLVGPSPLRVLSYLVAGLAGVGLVVVAWWVFGRGLS